VLTGFIFLSLGLAAVSAEPFPVFKNKGMDHDSITAKHSKTIIFFWTSKCYYCLQELRQINKDCLASYQDDIKFYYINIGESQHKVSRVVNSLNLKDCISDNIILDRELELAKEFNIFSIPTYIVFKDGEVVERAPYIDKEMINSAY
jgi:thioredoxin-related protein